MNENLSGAEQEMYPAPEKEKNQNSKENENDIISYIFKNIDFNKV